MQRIGLLTGFVFAIGCGGASTTSTTPPPPGSVSVSASASASGTPSSVASASPQPHELTPEEKKKAEEAQKLKDDRAQFEKDKQAELARWTPEMHAAAAALTSKAFASGDAAVKAALASPHRRPGNANRDKYRHPLETLHFFGLTPKMTVVEYAPGEGWYTELLAPVLSKEGKLYEPMSDPNGPVDQRSTLGGQRFKALLDTSPELYGHVQTIVVDSSAPRLGLDKVADLVLLIREIHGYQNSGTLTQWLAEAWKALKPKGVLGIVQHRAPAGTKPEDTSKNGYVAEAWVIAQVEAAGFKLDAKSEINANPKDTKDYPEGVWSLPPTYREKDANHAKYAAIGESDRMTLRFVKVK